MAIGAFLVVVAAMAANLLFIPAALPSAAQSASITLNPSTTYQTMNGWEATDYIGEPGTRGWSALPNYRDALLDRAADLGINRLRLEVYPGIENNTDYYTEAVNGQITFRDWVHTYGRSPVNDDGDPSHINWAGFQFSSLDWKIDNVVIPMRQRLEARGERLATNLCFVSFGTSNTGFYQYNSPQEYAEFMLAIFQHMQSKYGFVPDTIEVELEPENTSGFNGTKMGNAIKATIALLQANGFDPKYVVPSTTSMSNSSTYFDAIAAVLGGSTVRQYVQEISYHRYAGVSDSALQGIASRSVEYGIGASMLEWWDANNTYQTLHKDLTMGRNSAWQQGTILGIFKVDVTDPNNPVITTPAATQYFRQYFQFVRKDAVRIGTSTTSSGFDPVAFVNADGRYVVVVKAAAGGPFSIHGLPAGSYGVTYTTSSQANVNLPDVATSDGQALESSIPSAGVITVYGKTPSASAPLGSGSAADMGSGSPISFRLGFQALADQIPDVVGRPLENEHYGANGDSLQQTTTGLMVWRKADNWTAFTDGSRTWINGPFGVQDRSNDDRFDWEGR